MQETIHKLNKANLDWSTLLQTGSVKNSLDASHKALTEITNEVFELCPNLEYLYLDGNDLTELNPDLFPALPQLKWLDVRNNKLTSIPTSIVDHRSLQVLLLEGNNIKNLPIEIGSLSSLRGIQLARNPIEYPPQNIINLGVPSTIDFLRKQWQQLQSPQHIQLGAHSSSKTNMPYAKNYSVPAGTLMEKRKVSISKSAGVLKVNSHEPRRPRKAQSGLSAANLSKCISVLSISQRKPKMDAGPRGSEWADVYDNDEELLNSLKTKRKASNPGKRDLQKLNQPRGNPEDPVQPKQLREIWIEKIRHLLLAQESILQQRKNTEALQKWQDETKLQQQNNPKKDSDVEMNFPYDTDPGYLKMLSRKDLDKETGVLRKRELSLHQVRHEEPINSKIVSIMSALQELQTSQSAASASPRSEQRAIAMEISKIKEIQRSLSDLKLKNFGQLSLSP